MLRGILSGIEESIKIANSKLSSNDPNSKANNEAMAIMFSEIAGSQAFSDYFGMNISSIAMEQDQYGAMKTIVTEEKSGDYSFMPSADLYYPPEYYDEDVEIILREDAVFQTLPDDYVFTHDGMEVYKRIKDVMSNHSFFKEVFEWQGIDSLMEKTEEFSYRGDIKDLEKAIDPQLYTSEGRRDYDSLSLNVNNIAKHSGLIYFSVHDRGGHHNDMMVTGVKTPMGIASYVMFKDCDHEGLGDVKTLVSSGTATPLRQKGLLKRSIDLAIKEFDKSEKDDFVFRTSPGSDAPESFTKYMDKIFYENNKKGNTIFLQGQFNYLSLEKNMDISGEDKKEKIRDVALLVHKKMDRETDIKYDNKVVLESIKELSLSKKPSYTSTMSI